MRRFLLLSAVTMLTALAAPNAQCADPVYRHVGILNCGETAPQVDARVFINDGFFCADLVAGSLLFPNSALPYGTVNTLFFTNNSTMDGIPGFELDLVGYDGIHRMASSIVNGNGATIVGGQFTLLSATNLVNRGLLEVGGAGLMRLTGRNMDLSRSGLLVGAPGGTGGGCLFDYSGIIDPTNYSPEPGIDDLYWGVGSLTNLALDQLARQQGGTLVVRSPSHRVTNVFGFNTTVGPLLNPLAFMLTNSVVNGTNTNVIVQAVFVGNLDSNINAQVVFVDNTYPANAPPNNGFRTAIVEIIRSATNVVTGGQIIYSLYLTDQLATDTNLTSLTNIVFGTQRPASYILNTFPPCDFFLAPIAPNAVFDPLLLYDPATYSNRVVTANYAGYGAAAFLANVSPPASAPTNLPGRIEIDADQLDMSLTRIRGESQVAIKTRHLIASTNAVVDSPNLSYDLGSTNGLLRISGADLTRPTVERFGGTIFAWSGLWTNFMSIVVTNIGPDPNDPSMTVTNVATNALEMNFHALILDGGGLLTMQPVLLNDLTSRGRDVEFNDTIQVVRSLRIENENVTVRGTLDIFGPGTGINWDYTTVPNLKNLTNFGTINLPNRGEFGTRSRPYLSLMNTGTITAFSLVMDVDSFINRGQITTDGPLELNTRIGKIEGGQIAAGARLSLLGGDLKLRNAQVTASILDIALTNSLADDGVGAGNTLNIPNGARLLAKPRFGDLLGTTVRTLTPQFGVANYVWAGEDRGPTTEGYSNNVAIGKLVLGANPINLISFSGTSAGNALYVDFLTLQGAATNVESTLFIDSNFMIYFADANVSVEQLDGRLGGRLRWVKDFAGPNSSVDVLLLNGQTIQVNRALRNSLIIDSDGDGVVNGLDFYPFDAAVWASLSLTSVSGGSAPVLSWNSAPQTVYVLEYTTNLQSPNWQPLSTYTNTASMPGTISVLDSNLLSGDRQRFYRVRLGR